MTVATEVLAVKVFDITAGTPIPVAYPLYAPQEVFVYYGRNALIAQYNVDYIVTLGAAPNFYTFTLTPTASLLAKINALLAADTTEVNFITIRRELAMLTSSTPSSVTNTVFTSREIDRTVMKLQQLDERLDRTFQLNRSNIGDDTPLGISLAEGQPGKLLRWNDTGDGLANSLVSEDMLVGLLNDAITGGDAVGTAVGLSSLTLAEGVVFIRTNGYYEVGDKGGANYRLKSLGEPALPGDQTTNGGAKVWAINEDFANPRQFGAKADGVTSDVAPLRSAFAQAGWVIIPSGIYYVDDVIRLYAHSRIWCEPGTIFLVDSNRGGAGGFTFLNGPLGDTEFATGYDGDGDIRWVGGRIEFTAPSDNTIRCQPFGFAHARNVWLVEVEVEGWVRAHGVEWNAMADSGMIRCRFLNQVYTPGTDTNREAVQIDCANPGNFNGFGVEDGTSCTNLLFDGNYIDGADGGIGNHSGETPYPFHRNIKIVNNTIKNTYSFGIGPRHFYNSIIANNYVEGGIGRGIYVRDSPGAIVTGNEVVNCGSFPTSAVFFSSSDGCIFDDSNKVTNNGAVALHRDAIEFGPSGASASKDCIANTKGCQPGSSSLVNNNSPKVTLNGAVTFSVPDDGVAIFPMTAPSAQGNVSISTASANNYSARGIYWVRTVTPAVVPLAVVAAANVDVLTGGGVLTGTTGTDGKMTISAANGNVYVENRSGGALGVAIESLCG